MDVLCELCNVYFDHQTIKHIAFFPEFANSQVQLAKKAWSLTGLKCFMYNDRI
jgi:hypothetical protein